MFPLGVAEYQLCRHVGERLRVCHYDANHCAYVLAHLGGEYLFLIVGDILLEGASSQIALVELPSNAGDLHGLAEVTVGYPGLRVGRPHVGREQTPLLHVCVDGFAHCLLSAVFYWTG